MGCDQSSDRIGIVNYIQLSDMLGTEIEKIKAEFRGTSDVHIIGFNESVKPEELRTIILSDLGATLSRIQSKIISKSMDSQFDRIKEDTNNLLVFAYKNDWINYNTTKQKLAFLLQNESQASKASISTADDSKKQISTCNLFIECTPEAHSKLKNSKQSVIYKKKILKKVNLVDNSSEHTYFSLYEPLKGRQTIMTRSAERPHHILSLATSTQVENFCIEGRPSLFPSENNSNLESNSLKKEVELTNEVLKLKAKVRELKKKVSKYKERYGEGAEDP